MAGTIRSAKADFRIYPKGVFNYIIEYKYATYLKCGNFARPDCWYHSQTAFRCVAYKSRALFLKRINYLKFWTMTLKSIRCILHYYFILNREIETIRISTSQCLQLFTLYIFKQIDFAYDLYQLGYFVNVRLLRWGCKHKQNTPDFQQKEKLKSVSNYSSSKPSNILKIDQRLPNFRFFLGFRLQIKKGSSVAIMNFKGLFDLFVQEISSYFHFPSNKAKSASFTDQSQIKRKEVYFQ